MHPKYQSAFWYLDKGLVEAVGILLNHYDCGSGADDAAQYLLYEMNSYVEFLQRVNAGPMHLMLETPDWLVKEAVFHLFGALQQHFKELLGSSKFSIEEVAPLTTRWEDYYIRVMHSL